MTREHYRPSEKRDSPVCPWNVLPDRNPQAALRSLIPSCLAKDFLPQTLYMTTPELEAIRCYHQHSSFSPTSANTHRPKLSSLLTNRTSDGRSLHLTLWIDNDTGVVLEVEVHTVGSPPWLALTNDNRWHDLLPQLWLSLLDGRHDHVANTGGWQAVETGTETLDRDDVQVAGTAVVGAVHDGAAAIVLVLVFVVVCACSALFGVEDSVFMCEGIVEGDISIRE